MMKQTQKSWWVVACSVVLLAGCGGGGDAGPSAAVERLSAANYVDVATSVTQAVVGGATSVSDPVIALPAVEPGIAQQVQAAHASPVALARQALAEVSLESSGKLKAAAVSTTERACTVSGRLTVTADDADNSNTVSAGDTISATLTNCVLEAGQSPANGGFDLRISAVDAMGEPSAFTLTFRGFTSDGATLNGPIAVTTSGSTETLQFNGVSVAENGETVTYNHRLITDSMAGTVLASGTITVKGTVYTLATPLAIQLGATYPTAGTVVVTEDTGARLEVTMSPSGFTASLYLPGSAQAAGTATVAWSRL